MQDLLSLVCKGSIRKVNMKFLHERVPLLIIERAENVLDLRPPPAAVLVDLEGTLTEFCPRPISVIQALVRFDEAAARNGVPLNRVHYVTNANVGELTFPYSALSERFHPLARKPFFTAPDEFRLYGCHTFVVGDQYLTDGLLAWRLGFSFALVEAPGHKPAWPRLQVSVGRKLSRLFFKPTATSQSLVCSARPPVEAARACGWLHEGSA